MGLFEILSTMAERNMDIKRFDTVHSANATTKMGKITMRTDPQSVHGLGGLGKQTHVPMLIVVNWEQYQAIEKELAGK